MITAKNGKCYQNLVPHRMYNSKAAQNAANYATTKGYV